MMVLGPKHVGAFLMYKFYICTVVGVIIEWTNIVQDMEHGNEPS